MYEIVLDGGCVIISFASSNEYMNMNWSLYIYLLAIVEIAITVTARRGEFSDSSFFGKEGCDIC